MPECLVLCLNGHRFNNGVQKKKRLAFNYIFCFSSTHPSMPKHRRVPCTLNPWASWKRPTLDSVHINKLCPIRSMQKLIVGLFSNPHCFLALLQATQLDTSQGLCTGLNTANCSISAWSDSSPRCPRPFSNSAPPRSRHMKIESFGTQAERRDWEANSAGYSLPLPFGMINLQWEKDSWIILLTGQPPCPIWLPMWGEMDECFLFSLLPGAALFTLKSDST